MGAMAEGKKDALYVFAGAIAGTFLYAFLHTPLKTMLIDKGNLGPLTFDQLLGLSPLLTALLFAAAITVGMFLVDKLPQGQFRSENHIKANGQ
jgi:hypothetical protein